MKIIVHGKENKTVELFADGLIFNSIEEATQLIGELYYQGYDNIIWHQSHLPETFFDLSSGMAGEILQKISNFRMKLAIVGDFSKPNSRSLEAFITESNKGKQVRFASSLEEAQCF